ncbi:MAG TPA: hypothetical protein VGJ66_06555 [Pyrinomonadaceae bacterium]|jgi:hypothetical protein
MSGLLQDFRFAGRMLRKTPAFTAAAVISLALRIGANTAIFQLLNAITKSPENRCVAAPCSSRPLASLHRTLILNTLGLFKGVMPLFRTSAGLALLPAILLRSW